MNTQFFTFIFFEIVFLSGPNLAKLLNFTTHVVTTPHFFNFMLTNSGLTNFTKIGNATNTTGRDDEHEQEQAPIHLQSEQTYYVGETIATLLVDEHANVTKCNILKAHTWPQKREAFAKLKANFVSETTLETMLGFIRTCHSLDKSYSADDNEDGEENVVKEREQGGGGNPIDSTVQTAASVFRAVTGILPGTKWCGLNNVAHGWHDLGDERELDKCCRGHDVCPKTVSAFGRAYDLLNLNVYTSSHCECDAMFYDCLKEIESSQDGHQTTPTTTVAGLLGNLYFNVLRVQCINEENPPKCTSRTKLRRGRGYGDGGLSCLEWEEEPSRTGQKLVFREFGHRW